MSFIGYFIPYLGALIHVFGFSFWTLGLFNSLNSLPGSWFVFIVEMNTLFGCFWAELEYEYVVLDPWVSFGG